MNALTCTLVAAALGAADGGIAFPPEVRAREDALVKSFGLTPPDGGVLLTVTAPGPDPRWLVVPSRWHADKPPQSVDAAALRADLPVLGAALEQGYSGYERGLKRGWRWALWLKEWDTTLEVRRGPLPLQDAFAIWEQVREFQPDGLTGIMGVPNPWRSLTASLEKAPRGTCEELQTVNGRYSALVRGDAALQPRAVELLGDKGKVERGWMIVAPEPLGPLKQVNCSGGSTEAFSVWNPTPKARLQLVKALGGTDGPGLAELEPRVWWLRPGPAGAAVDFSKLPADAVLLVDLRQLGPAPPAADPALLKVLGAPADVPFPISYRRRSCGAEGLRFGVLQAAELTGAPHSLAASQPLLAALQPGTCKDAVEKTGGPLPKGGRKKPSLKAKPGHRAVVLVDNGCEGACESLAFQLSLLPDTVLAGTATAGRDEYAEPGRLVLPRTRVPIQIALTRRDFFADGRSFDGYGLPPDVLIESEASWAPEVIRAFARQLLPAAPKGK
ncbi:MAG TPA: hypothetical protein VFA20_26485 [Myxococcaceae bacterium]|nr:hypothetical protein [Myxococcaceae bacterium]